ncbi:unnamed protein product, partial [Ascophyllum nodosum]
DNASCRDRDKDTSGDTLTILPAFEPKNGGADDTITPTAATVATALGLPLSPSESANSHSDAESIKTKGASNG